MDRSERRQVGRGLVAGLILLMGAGCGDLFDVENPGSLTDEELGTPQLLNNLINTAEGNFADMYDGAVFRNGLSADEIFHETTQLENIDMMRGNRLASISTVETQWNNLSQVRWLADEMAERVAEMVPNPESHVGVAWQYFWGGMARIVMADHYNVIVYSPEDQPRGPLLVFRDAIEKLERAAQIAQAAGEANVRAAALGQIARTYRALYFEERQLRGNEDPSFFAQAESYALQALETQPGYDVSVRYGAPGGSNTLASLGGPFGGTNRIDEAYLFLPDPVTGEWDPRVPHEENLVSELLGMTAWNLKHARREAPIPVSRASESMLIIAEARLLEGDLAGAVHWINQNRAAARVRTSSSDWGASDRGWPPERPLSDLRDFQSNDADEIYAQLRHERKADFWLEGRAWQDHRYYEVFPYRWFTTNMEQGHSLRWRPSPAEIAGNPNLNTAMAGSVLIDN